MKPGRIVMVVLGTLSALLGLGLLAGAVGVGWLNFQQRDEGYFTTQTHRFEVSSYAITSAGLDIMVGGRLPDVIPSDSAGSILLRGASATPGKEIFIGVAPQEDAARYLDGVKRSEIRDLELRPFRVQYNEVPGTRTPTGPGAQGFWAASAEGTGTQELRWDVRPGSWTVVVMNADGGSQVAANVSVGATAPVLSAIVIGLLVTGGILLLASIVIVLVSLYAGRRDSTPKEGVSQ